MTRDVAPPPLSELSRNPHPGPQERALRLGDAIADPDTRADALGHVAAQGDPAEPARRTLVLSTQTEDPAPPGPVPGHEVRLESGAVIGQYEIIRELGRGGMGAVYLARDVRLGRRVAIKFLAGEDGTHKERFLAEARATARCKHENIVVIHDVGEADGQPYMVLEHLEGVTLRAWLQQRPFAGDASADSELFDRHAPVAPELAIELMMPVVRALAHAHELGIVHRDLKPENIFLTDAGTIKVLDFGIAKVLEPKVMALSTNERDMTPFLTEPSFKTGAGRLVGTFPYMSPEQWQAAEDIDGRSDLWAVGVMLYEMVTGHHPMAPLSYLRLMEVAHLDVPMPLLGKERPELGALGALVDECLRKPRAERPASAQAVLGTFEPLLGTYRLREQAGPGEPASPFTGLAAFQEADAERFFGREHDIAGMLARLRSERLVTVAGPSGAGKSSFVRAGVIPALKRAGTGWDALIVRPGRRPLAALASTLAQVAPTTTPLPDADAEARGQETLLATLRAQPGYLGARLRALCRQRRGRMLLFVDQFEELYTLGADRDERARFFACLEGVADDASSPLRVMLTVRSDFLDRVAEDRAFMHGVTRGLVLLPCMDRDSLRQALVRPIERADHGFESADMVESMLDALEATRSPLPLLQFAATALWDARDRERKLLTRTSYDELGGVAGALSRHADVVLSGLSPSERRWARAVLLQLVTPERTRAIVSMDELRALADDASGGAPGQSSETARSTRIVEIVQRLADARLVLIETGGEHEAVTVELVHESLIQRWPTLGRWLEESAEDVQFLARLRAAAEQWEADGQAEGLLWRDRAARDAERWLERWRAEPPGTRSMLGKREERYLHAVVALSGRMRRRRRRMAAVAFATLAVIATVVSYLAIRADREAARAQAEAVQARNAVRVAAAREQEDDPMVALALLREVEPPHLPRGWSELVSRTLQSGVAHRVFAQPAIAYSAALSPDGKRIVVALGDNTVRVENVDGTGEPLVLRGHKDYVDTAAFSPDGTRIVSSSGDRTARIWNADGTGEPLVLGDHGRPVTSAWFSPDGSRIVTSSVDRIVRVWNVDGSGTPLVLRGHTDWIRNVAFSPDGTRLVSASEDQTVRVWSADGTGQPLVLRGHTAGATYATFSPDSKRIVSAGRDATVRVWNADGTGQPLVLQGHQDIVYSVQFTPDGASIISASRDRTVRIWNADGTGEPLVLRGHKNWVYTAVLGSDGTSLVTASLDRTVRLWHLDRISRPRAFHGHREPIHVFAFSPDGTRIVTGSADATARVWNVDGLGDPMVLAHESAVNGVTFSPDGKRIVTGSDDGTVRVWNADGSGTPIVLRRSRAAIQGLTVSPDSIRMATLSADSAVRVWNVDGSGEPIVFRGALRLAFSPDSTRIVTVSADDPAHVWVWQLGGPDTPLVLRGHTGPVEWVEFSPDGERIVSGSQDRTARVWNADGTGEPIVLRGHKDLLWETRFSPDGTRVATESDDGTVRVWNADGSGQPIVLSDHTAGVGAVRFSPDGTRIVTASKDATVRVWNADGSGAPRVFSSGTYTDYLWAAWSPDSARIAMRSDGKILQVWSDIEPFGGPGDLTLWRATTYCMPADRRMELLGVSEDAARAAVETCRQRVARAEAIGLTRP